MTLNVKIARNLPLRLKLAVVALAFWSSNLRADQPDPNPAQPETPASTPPKPALPVATSKAEPAQPQKHRSLLGSGLFLNMGGSVAVAGHKDASTSATVGAEVSLVAFNDGPWSGGYLDARYDFGAEEGRISVGPELGYAMFGLDAGVYRRIGPGPDQWGTTNFFEGGLLLKVPLELTHWE